MATTAAPTSTAQVLAGIGSQYFGSTVTSSSASPSNTLNQSDFLTLFTAQLQNQDPTNPMQSYELASQLAQFTTVEQLTQVSSSLKNVDQYAGGINNGEITSLVGKTVTANDSTLNVSSGNVTNSLNYAIATPSNVTYKVTDSSGDTIYSGSIGAQNSGNYAVPWTGKDSSGNTVVDGAYTCTVTATPSDGAAGAATLSTTTQGQVVSCNLGTNPPTYTLSGANGLTLPVSSVCGVSSN